MKLNTLFFTPFLSIILFSCNASEEDNGVRKTDSNNSTTDEGVELINHSFANTDEVHTTHLYLELDVNFEEKKITGVAHHTMKNNGAYAAIFDVDQLTIDKVTIGEEQEPTEFYIGEHQKGVGSPLVVSISDNTEKVSIYYTTSKEAAALDWLPASLTWSKKHPFLYTQGQPILTRSWIPIQDVPSNRITYSADVSVPRELLALMSAKNPTRLNEEGNYSFEMNQPIPSYLIALAVGEIEYHPFDERSGIYAEPAVLPKAAQEFEDVPEMIDIAEELYGDYLWDQYDAIVLPYSFPFGGMENPRLTFLTPTLITGDKSLVSVIAHELAHSWSGNLVTNATWDDIWLNEGFTVYFENRILEEIYGKEIADILFLIEFQELEETMDKMFDENRPEQTHLKLDLTGENPDDGLNDIAYVKGALFLKTLEHEIGRAKMDEFMTNYFQSHQFRSILTEEFVEYLNEHLLVKENIDFNVDEWVYGEGIPDNHLKITSTRLEALEELAKKIQAGEPLPKELKRNDKITQEWQNFIRTFGNNLDPKIMKEIDQQINFKASGNSELMTEWFILGIKSGYDDIYDEIEEFLLKIGRRKFIKPIYKALSKTEKNLAWAREVYEKARPNYHAVSYRTIDDILGWDNQ